MCLTLGLGLFAPPGKVLKTEDTHGASSSRPTMIIQAGLEAWKEACSALEDAARGDESPENLFGFAVVQWWLGEIQESERCFEQKYAAFHRHSDLAQTPWASSYFLQNILPTAQRDRASGVLAQGAPADRNAL